MTKSELEYDSYDQVDGETVQKVYVVGGNIVDAYTKLESDTLFVKKYTGAENRANRIFSMTGGVTLTNTIIETSMLDGGVGSKIIPANTLKVGDIIRVEFTCQLTCGTSQSSTIRIKLGNSTLVTSTAQLPNNLAANLFEGSVDILILSLGTNGTAKILGRSIVQQNNLAGLIRDLNNVALTQINTEIDNAVDFTYQWATASASNINVSHRALIHLI